MTALTFLGAAGTVTGSRTLVESGRTRVLVDCGLFQGYKTLRLRNWAPFPVAPDSLDAVVLTHAHLDHSGYLPLLVERGYAGDVFCTAATADLCGVLLPDSGYLQEKDAEFANKHGFSKHRPALPLYTERDAEDCLASLRPVAFGEPVEIAPGIEATFRHAGHILGAASVTLRTADHTVVFSGDVGRPDDPVMPAPEPLPEADALVVESTYGDRRHPEAPPDEALAAVVNETAARGGTVLIPAFAVGRSQLLLYLLHELKTQRRIPDLPVFLDSPMAIDATQIFCRHPRDHRLSAEAARAACAVATYVHTPEESKALDRNGVPKVIVSASGMATGGRVLHHLKHYGPDPRNTLLFAGFQAGGTRGADLLAGRERVKIHGRQVTIRAEVRNLTMLSAHADADELLDWMRGADAAPRAVYVNHGEPDAADVLRRRIQDELGWSSHVPEQMERVELP